MAKTPATPRLFLFLFVLINIALPVLSQVPPGSPVISGPEIIVRGADIVLTCTSTGGNPTPSVKWFRDDTEITAGISTSTSGSVVTTTYSFVATLNEHYEVFECQAENGVLQNPLKTTKFVFVHYTPNIPILAGPTSLVAGDPGSWTCTSSNGYPAGTMTIRNTNTGTTFSAPEYTSTNTAVNGGRSFTVVGTLNWSPALANNGNEICCVVAHSTTITTPQSVCQTLTVRAPLAINAPVLSYTPTIGTSVTLQCVVTSGNPTIITWYKGNTQLNPATDSRYSNGNLATPSMTINSVQQSDAGDYTCRANDGSVSVNTNNINVAPQGTPPVVTIPVNSYTQTVGNSITLVCQVSSPNSALQTVQWMFTNQNGVTTDPIVTTTSKYSGSTTTNPSLAVNNVQFTDEGTYRCRATNLIGTTLSAQTTFLDVQGTLPVLNIPQDTYTAVYGEQLVIGCTIVSANPAVTNIYWTRQSGGNTVTINNGDNDYQGSTPQTPALTINFVTPAHIGTYRCHGTNVVGTGNSNQAAVTVTGGLLSISQSPSSANVLQGSATTVTCIVSGSPPANSITWLYTANGGSQGVLNKVVSKHTGGTTGNPSLTINNFQSTDAGTYTCQAANAAGTTTSSTSTILTFMQRMILAVNPADGTAIVGDNSYTINCQLSGVPSATSTSWFRRPVNGGQQVTINAGNNKYTITANGNNLILTINNIVEADEADYFCTATNLAGAVTSTRARLIVNGGLLSITQSPSSANVLQGSATTVICIVFGSPPANFIIWLYTPDGGSQRTLNKVLNKHSGGSIDNPSLSINNFQSTDAGTYTCQAVNAVGTTTSSTATTLTSMLVNNEICEEDIDQYGRTWNQTSRTTTSVKQCDGDRTGSVTRLCRENGMWENPDYTNCIRTDLNFLDHELQSLKNDSRSTTNVSAIVRELETITSTVKDTALVSGDLQLAADILNDVAVYVDNSSKVLSNDELEPFVSSCNNLLEDKNIPGWLQLKSMEYKGVTQLARSVPVFVKAYNRSFNTTFKRIVQKENIVVQAGKSFPKTIVFPDLSSLLSNGISDTSTKVLLNKDSLKGDDIFGYSFVYYRNVSDLFHEFHMVSGQAVVNAIDFVVNSAVVDVSIEPNLEKLDPPLTISFDHYQNGYYSPECVFWNFNAENTPNGAWSTAGSKLVETSNKSTTCHFYHTTNFAIIMSPSNTPEAHRRALSIISTIGCCISIAFLSLTLAIFVLFWSNVTNDKRGHIKRDSAITLMNFCVVLILSYSVFLAGIRQTGNKELL